MDIKLSREEVTEAVRRYVRETKGVIANRVSLGHDGTALVTPKCSRKGFDMGYFESAIMASCFLDADHAGDHAGLDADGQVGHWGQDGTVRR